MIDFAFYTSHKDNTPQCASASWPEIVELLSVHRESSCDADRTADNGCVGKECTEKRGHAWSPVRLLPLEKAKRTAGDRVLRDNENVEAVTALVIDLDHIDVAALGAALTKLAGYAVVVHSTHNHRPPNDVSARLVLPLSRPVLAADWPRFLANAVSHFQLPADPTCKDLSRLYFLPSHPRGGEFFSESESGSPLDVDAILALEVQAKPLRPTASRASQLLEIAQESATHETHVPVAREAVGEPVVIDFERLLGDVKSLRTTYRRKGDAEKFARMERVLAGKPLAVPGGALENPEGLPVGRDAEIHKAMCALACKFPSNTPVEAALEVVRRSIGAMVVEPEGLDYWLDEARDDYERAMVDRVERDRRVKAVNDKINAGLRALGGPDAKGDGRGSGGASSSRDGVPSDRSAGGAPEGDSSDPEDEPEAPWTDELLWRPLAKGEDPDTVTRKLENSPHNAALILTHVPEWKGVIRWNDLRKTIEAKGGPLRESDRHINVLPRATADHLQKAYGLRIDEGTIRSTLLLVARRNIYNPLREYLLSLEWDGVSRIDDALVRYASAATIDDDGQDIAHHVRRIGRKWLTAACARALRPGVQADNVLVLEGPMGFGKTSFFRILAGPFAASSTLDLGSKDAQMLASVSWIIELAELATLAKASGQETADASITTPVARFRPPYGAAIEEFHLPCIFGATTESHEWLATAKGSRRWWPVKITAPIDKAALRRDRDQLLAEAVVVAQAALAEVDAHGEAITPEVRWHLDGSEESEAHRLAALRVQTGVLEETIENWWHAMDPAQRPKVFQISEVMSAALKALPADRTQRGNEVVVGRALKTMGFQKARKAMGGVPKWVYLPTEELINAPKLVRSSAPIMSVVAGARTAR